MKTTKPIIIHVDCSLDVTDEELSDALDKMNKISEYARKMGFSTFSEQSSSAESERK